MKVHTCFFTINYENILFPLKKNTSTLLRMNVSKWWMLKQQIFTFDFIRV